MLLAAAFPKSGQSALAWIALAPLMLALRQTSPRRGFGLGLASGFIANLGLMYWTVHAMHVYGYIPLVQSISVLVLFALVLGLFSALFGWLIAGLCRRAWHLLWLAPALWTALEFIRTWIFSGFPWALLGYSQYQFLHLIQIADLFGVYAVSAFLAFVNAVLVLALLYWVEKDWQGDQVSRPLMIRSAAVLGMVLVIVIGYGIMRIQRTDRAASQAPKSNVAVIQGNIDQAHKWDPSFQVLTTVKYKNISLDAAGKGAELIVWPETATPFYLFEDQLLTSIVLEGIKQADAAYVIGSPSVEFDADRPGKNYFNSAYLISPAGEDVGRYDKVHLVPFGEYVPLQRLLWFVDKLVAQAGDFHAGRPGHSLEYKQHRIGMLICYETIFPALARAMVANGANILVNITNDAWYGRTSAPYQHFSMAVLRAVENRRFLARAANTGISGVIDPNGRQIVTSALFEDGALISQVALLKARTLYSRWGDWPLGTACVVAILAAGLRRRRTHRASAQPDRSHISG